MTPDPIDVPAIVSTLKALANPSRLRVALHLVGGEKGVGELETELGLRQPTLSQHLAELREAGVVSTRREVRNVFYALSDPRAEALLATMLDPSAPSVPAEPGRTRSARSDWMEAATFATVGSERQP